MTFSSLEFVCVFFPLAFLLHCLVPSIHAKNLLLVLVSLLFYAYGEPRYVLLMFASAWFNYGAARLMDVFRYKRLMLAISVIFNLGLLGFFKYAAFAVETGNWVFDGEMTVPAVELPIGISFFTFQAMSYVIDVYRKKVPVQKSFLNILFYISFFPQLIAGPIVKYRDISESILHREIGIKQVSDGMRRFICGLGKKVLIANTVGQAADAVFHAEYGDINMLGAWIGAIAYMLQIYYDFSGYSDMAVGLGKMFGFTFPENFRYPYGAVTVKEFWQKWHISLSSWFKEYLYIPMGGSRKGKFRTGINKLIVFFCTGFWHGADWTFIIWGLYHGFFSVLEEFVPVKKFPRAITWLYTMLVVCVGFVLFRAENFSQGMYIIGQMFTGISFNEGSMSFAAGQMTPWFLAAVLAGIVGMAPIKPLVDKIRGIMEEQDNTVNENVPVQAAIYAGAVLLLVWCILRLSGNTYNPFIYFRF